MQEEGVQGYLQRFLLQLLLQLCVHQGWLRVVPLLLQHAEVLVHCRERKDEIEVVLKHS